MVALVTVGRVVRYRSSETRDCGTCAFVVNGHVAPFLKFLDDIVTAWATKLSKCCMAALCRDESTSSASKSELAAAKKTYNEYIAGFSLTSRRLILEVLSTQPDRLQRILSKYTYVLQICVFAW